MQNNAGEKKAAKVAFTSSVNLLKSVITKQAGNWRKGLKELIQNSIDGCLLNTVEPNISVNVEPTPDGGSSLTFKDNAGGLGENLDEVKRNFAVFGDSQKAGDARMLGMFGMGRGQTMSMIYDPVSDSLKGHIEILTVGKKTAFRITNVRLTEDIGFDIEEVERTKDMVPGVEWRIVSTAGKFKLKDVLSYVKDEFVLPFPIHVNDKKVRNRPGGRKVENELAVVYIKDMGNGFELYERGLRVMRSALFDGFSGTIVTKTPLNLNFARNDVIEDKRWDAIKKLVKDTCLAWFEENQGKHLTETKQAGLIAQMADDDKIAARFANEKIITLANGNKVSFNDLRGDKVLSAKAGDRVADDLIQGGTIVLDRGGEGYDSVEALCRKKGIEVASIEDEDDIQKRRRCKTVEPKEDERKPLRFLNNMMALCGYRSRKVVVGECELKSFDGWTDSVRYIAVRRDLLRSTMKKGAGIEKDPLAFWLDLLPLMAHEQAHDTDDTETSVHGPAFRENNLEILERMVHETAHADAKSVWERGA